MPQFKVWVGFSDGKPDKWLDSLQVFTTKREAAAAYEDHRRATLVVEPKRRVQHICHAHELPCDDNGDCALC